MCMELVSTIERILQYQPQRLSWQLGQVNTKKIRLTSAVSILSSMDPIRLFQQYATIDALSNGRAEIMAGRGFSRNLFPCLDMI